MASTDPASAHKAFVSTKHIDFRRIGGRGGARPGEMVCLTDTEYRDLDRIYQGGLAPERSRDCECQERC